MNMNQSNRPALLALLLVSMLFSCAPHQGKVTLLYTNDMHAHFLPEEASWIHSEPRPLIGGMNALKYYIDSARDTLAGRELVLDAGDWMTGTPISDIEVSGVKGAVFIEMMNRIGYDATVIGNHEFDNGVGNLKGLIDAIDFDVVTANLLDEAGELIAPHPWKIYQRNGVRIGVIGLILDVLDHEASSRALAGSHVLSVRETAQKMIDEIDSRTDLIVLLTHQGWREDSLLATQVTGADVIVGGHSHTRLTEPQPVNDVLVLQTGSYTHNLGYIDLTVDDDRVTAYDGRLVPTWVDGIRKDPGMDSLVTFWEQRIDELYSAIIGYAPQDLARSYYGESPLGNYLTDLLLDYTGTDFALLNSGGLRQNLNRGDITRLDIIQILPFQNYVVTFDMTGAQLLEFLQHNATVAEGKEHGILQYAGLTCRYRSERGRVVLENAQVGGEPIDPLAQYRGSSVDYVLDQYERYIGFMPEGVRRPGDLLSDAIIKQIKAGKQGTGLTGRLTRIQ